MTARRVLSALAAACVVTGCSATPSAAPPGPSSPGPVSSTSAPTSSAPAPPPRPTATSARPSPVRPTRTTPAPPAPTRSPSGGALDQLEALAEQAAETAVEQALGAAGISLASGPDCTAALALDASGRSASGTVTCTGTTTAGLPVKGTLTGTFAAGACQAQLVVTVAGRVVAQETITQCGTG